MEHIKYLENIIFNLRNELKSCKHQNRELKDDNHILRKYVSSTGVDPSTLTKHRKETSRSVEKQYQYHRIGNSDINATPGNTWF